MKLWWTYNDWDGKCFMIGGDEYYRKTLVISTPFTGHAIVFPISRVGKLYDPEHFPDSNFERWRRIWREDEANG